MSDYTTQLRFICEAYAGKKESAESADVDEIINLARPKIFDFEYPIFDEDYRKTLENKIISHYYTQEIGLETVGLWKLKLRTKMREIMPYYNQLYKSELLKFDPFINTDYKDDRLTTGTGNSIINSNGTTGVVGTGETTTDTVSNHTGNQQGTDTSANFGTGNGTDNRTGNSETGTTSETTDKKTGNDTATFTPQSGKTTLVKNSDTPLGSVNGVTAVGDNSNFLSNVTETVENYNGNSGHDETKTTYNTTNKVDGTTNTTTSNSESGATQTDNFNSEATNYIHDDKSDDKTNQITKSDTKNDTTTNSTSETSDVNMTDYAGRLFGKTGSETYSEMLNKFRNTFLNIDLDVINELNDLFMLIW